MDASITSIAPSMLQSPALDTAGIGTAKDDPAKLAKASRQFESILVRQFLSESMKPLLESGPSGQVYGYLLTDSLAESISKGGGLGLSHVLQTQLTRKK
jgi:peptidoglycan hydrolase FlgJ